MLTDQLKSTPELSLLVENGEIISLAVDNPLLPNGATNTQYLQAVAKEIGEHPNGNYKVVVNKSTVPIGTASTSLARHRVADSGVSEHLRQTIDRHDHRNFRNSHISY